VFLVVTQNSTTGKREARKAKPHMNIVDFLTAITSTLMEAAPPELQPRG
jgi:hypothetical protein